MEMFGRIEEHLVPAAMDVLRLALWFALLLLIFGPLERLFGLRKQKLFRKAFGMDIVYYFLSSLGPKLLLVVPLSLIAAGLHRVVPSGYYAWVAALPLVVRLGAALVAGEAGYYWAHRWAHEVPLLWRFHAVHHGPEEMDWLVNSHAHPIDMCFTRLCSYVPMFAFGLAQPLGYRLDAVPILVTMLGTMWGFFIHANVQWRLGWLEQVVSSPAFHHWHHTNAGPQGVNNNYSSMLPWLDRCFGTYSLPKKFPEKYGINEPVPASFGGQLIQPFLPGGAAAPAETGRSFQQGSSIARA